MHYLRPEQAPAGNDLELHGAAYITDEEGILADGTIIEVTLSASVITPAKR